MSRYTNLAVKFSIFLIPAITLLSACGNSNSSSDNKKDSSETVDTGRYIKIEDATAFHASWSKENVIIYHEVGEPDDMHPSNGLSVSRSEKMAYTQVYLVGVDYRNLTSRPIAVKHLPVISENGLEYTYELRDDITFDNGNKLSVEDVIFTFKANKCPLTNNPNSKPYLENLLDIIIDKANPNKFTLKLKRKYIQNIAFLADYPIMQRTFFDKENVLSKYTFAQFSDEGFKADQNKDLNDWATEFNSPKYGRDLNYLKGAGPYYIERWEPGQGMTLAKKKNHWSFGSNNMYEKSFPEKIIYKLNKDQNSQILEFKSQVMDASTSVSTTTLLELQKDANFNANFNSRFSDTYSYGYIAMNLKPDGIKHQQLFTDKNVRHAIALLVPLDDINNIVNKGKNKRVVGPVSPLKPEYNNDLKLIPYDVTAAKNILDQAGWKDTDGDNIRDKMIDGKKVKFEFNLNYFTSDVSWKDIARMVSEGLYKAGIKAVLNPLDGSVLYSEAKNHDFDMMIAAWGGSYVPEDYTQVWHTSSWSSKGSNFGGFGNAVSDALIDSIKYELNDDKRNQMIKRFQKIVYDDQPYVFMFAYLRRNIIHKRFGNQEIYFERPGVWIPNLKLLPASGKVLESEIAN